MSAFPAADHFQAKATQIGHNADMNGHKNLLYAKCMMDFNTHMLQL